MNIIEQCLWTEPLRIRFCGTTWKFAKVLFLGSISVAVVYGLIISFAYFILSIIDASFSWSNRTNDILYKTYTYILMFAIVSFVVYFVFLFNPVLYKISRDGIQLVRSGRLIPISSIRELRVQVGSDSLPLLVITYQYRQKEHSLRLSIPSQVSVDELRAWAKENALENFSDRE